MSLRLVDFAAFHVAVHGYAPFTWQERLLQQVNTERHWPRVVDLPTGSGKTTCIDIALFLLAIDAQREMKDRWCSRRTAMIVDRRVVVDQVAERGRLLLKVLTESSVPEVQAVRGALTSLTNGKEEPLAVYTLRGGIPKDDGWARAPHQPLVLASTVDQLGSRLLIQGYGVSPGMRPVHAGLLANDTLVLLDEVHLSRPFAETLDALSALSKAGTNGTQELPRRSSHVFLSATPGDEEEPVFRLEPLERDASTRLGQRLHATKPARLEAVASRDELPERCVALLAELLKKHRVIAVVSNRVATAREVAARVAARDLGEVDVVLLTGRMRPLDRDDILAKHLSRIAAGRKRSVGQRALVVVGTQCIEAGADFDFDALITESASLDALRQRFGRVDRLGEYGSAEGVVIHVKEEAKADPLYGAARAATWSWLKDVRHKKSKTVDFGVEHLRFPADIAELIAPRKSAPILLPAYLDLWMQTAPEPASVPDPSLFLHGPESGPPDVQVVWRADLTDDDLEYVTQNGGDDGAAHRRRRDDVNEAATAIVGAVRPSSLEALSLPFTAARTWLRGRNEDKQRADADVMDVDAVTDAAPPERDLNAETGKTALRWRGAAGEVITWKELRPGDTIVIPNARGGVRNGNFDPTGAETVVDVAERAALLSRGRPVLRTNTTVLAGLGLSEIADWDDLRFAVRSSIDTETVPWKAIWLKAILPEFRVNSPWRRTIVEPLDGRAPWVVCQGKKLSPDVLRQSLNADAQTTVEDGADLTTDEGDSFNAGRAGVTLQVHTEDVERYARAFAESLGLPDEVISDIGLAAWLHDLGKADPRFQLLLRGGDEVELYKDERLWAKSVMRSGDRAAQKRAQRRSGYPRGTRHEVQSVVMIEQVRTMVEPMAHDIDLVLHLVASHHGYCRPFAPAVVDPTPVDVAVSKHSSTVLGSFDFPSTSSNHRLYQADSPLADRFWSLADRYGWFSLCWLEAILRLADHRASEDEEEA